MNGILILGQNLCISYESSVKYDTKELKPHLEWQCLFLVVHLLLQSRIASSWFQVWKPFV